MRAVRFDGPRRLRIDEVATPAVVEPGDVVVRVTTAAIGPLDLERYGGPDPWGAIAPGGACAGVVEETGRDVRRWRLGDVVLVPPALRFDGQTIPILLGRDLDGSHAGWIRVPGAELNLVSIPDPLNLEAQAVVAAETHAGGAGAADLLASRSPASSPSSSSAPSAIAVIGCGPSALSFIPAWLSKKPTYGRIVAIDSAPGRVLFARRLGATGVVDRGVESAKDAICSAGKCDRFDAVVLGNRVEGTAIELAISLAAPDAPIVTLDPPGVGWSTDPRVTAIGFPTVAELEGMVMAIRSGALDLLPLVSHTFPLAEAVSAFESAFRRERGVLKVLLKP